MGVNPSGFSASGAGKEKVTGRLTNRHPVESVSWLDVVTFCNRLSTMEGVRPFYEIDDESVRVLDWNGVGYRLPTEAEWEYACRAMTKTRYSFGDDVARAGEFAWSNTNAGDVTHPVGGKRPNEFGLYDMNGNVSEWCWDWYGSKYYVRPPVEDPRGPDGGTDRVVRGGAWVYADPGWSGSRGSLLPGSRFSHLGFRLARGQSSR